MSGEGTPYSVRRSGSLTSGINRKTCLSPPSILSHSLMPHAFRRWWMLQKTQCVYVRSSKSRVLSTSAPLKSGLSDYVVIRIPVWFLFHWPSPAPHKILTTDLEYVICILLTTGSPFVILSSLFLLDPYTIYVHRWFLLRRALLWVSQSRLHATTFVVVDLQIKMIKESHEGNVVHIPIDLLDTNMSSSPSSLAKAYFRVLTLPPSGIKETGPKVGIPVMVRSELV